MGLMGLLFGTPPTRCGECGAKVLDGEGFRVPPIQVYCSEEHAYLDQQMPAM